jgi:hypothetical protein
MKICQFCANAPVGKGRTKTCSVECGEAFARRRKLEYSRSDPEKTRAYNREYYRLNRERCAASIERCRQNQRAKIEREPSKRLDVLIRSCRLSAKRKGIAFNIDRQTLDNAIILQGGVCALTKMAFDWGFGVEHRANPFGPSVDRIDSKIGYIPSNVQVVCYIVNLAKNEYSVDLFDEMCRARIKVIGNG